MKVAGIICEYNPFHNGHERQIRAIREKFGEDTAVIAVMSGNFTQRAEPAIFDKIFRAQTAVNGGVNLVIELPFPYCASGAEYFASAGVKLLNSLGIVDVLSFGAECDSTEQLEQAAKNLASDTYLTAFETAKNENITMGHAALSESVYCSLYGKEESTILSTPNNILAIEYIKAVRKYGARFSLHAIKRNTDYLSNETIGEVFASATAIRNKMQNGEEYFPFVSRGNYTLYHGALKEGNFCAGIHALSTPLLSSLMLNKTDAELCFDADAGLIHRLQNSAKKATDVESLIQLSETKKYTKARLRRVTLYSYFGVTSSDFENGPAYVQILAADSVGCSLLKQMKKTAALPILTKPADVPFSVQREKDLSDKADTVFALAKVRPTSAKCALAFTPYIKK